MYVLPLRMIQKTEDESVSAETEEEKEEQQDRIKSYWDNLTLLAEMGQDIVGGNVDTLTARSLYAVLKIAIEVADLQILGCCLSLGIPVNEDSHLGLTPLMMCIEKDSPQLVEKVVEFGADVNLRTKRADSPLHYCVERNKLRAAEALIKAGGSAIDLDILGSDGYAPLHRAAKHHMRDMIYLLVNNGADVNVKGENGCTPLHVAANCV